MRQAIEDEGGRLLEVLTCFHSPQAGCSCRKPAPGLLQEAAARHGIDARRSILVGDHANDLEAARLAGIRSIIVLSGRTVGQQIPLPSGCIGVYRDLLSVAHWLIDDSHLVSDEACGTPPALTQYAVE
jgi:histidinol phosphatase-like enzyme